MTNVEKVAAVRGRHSGFVIDSSFSIRPLGRSWAKASHSSFSVTGAFTVIELIVVVTIIFILAGLVLSTVGYVRKKGARARAETEIAAMSAACESYKADNGIYPTNSDTQTLDPTSEIDPTANPPNDYTRASLWLYEQLSGDPTGNRQPTGKSYMAFKPNMLLPAPPSTANVTAIADPFGNSYGYSTRMAVTGSGGYNPTFDLWSTAGGTTSNDVPKWIKNW
jgi:type II secretory pathway pseudopilin PulG